MPSQKTLLGLQTVLLCAGFSVLLGLNFFGPRIFDLNLVFFQIFAGGIVGGVYVAIFRIRKPRSLIFAVPIIFGLLLLSTQSTTQVRIFRDVVWVLGILIAVGLGQAVNKAIPRVAFGKFLLWTVIFGAMHYLMLATLHFFSSVSLSPIVVQTGVAIGATIGCGLGLGSEFSYFFSRPLRQEREAVLPTEASS